MGRDNAQTTAVLPILWESKRNQRNLISVSKQITKSILISSIVQWIDLV